MVHISVVRSAATACALNTHIFCIFRTMDTIRDLRGLCREQALVSQSCGWTRCTSVRLWILHVHRWRAAYIVVVVVEYFVFNVIVVGFRSLKMHSTEFYRFG